jgi:hypothetical protein
VDVPKPVRAPEPPLNAKPTATPKKRAARKTSDDPAKIPLPPEWAPNEGHFDLAYRKYGYQLKHVEFEAEQMRNHAEQNGRTQVSWDAAFRTWLQKGWEFRGGKPPEVPVPPPPKEKVPPPPPMHPAVKEAADRAAERAKNGEVFDVSKMFRNVGNPFARLETSQVPE